MALSRIFSIFLLIAVGYVTRKTKLLDENGIRAVSNLVLTIALPCTIISSFDRSIPFSAAKDLIEVAIYAIAIHGISIALSEILFSKMERTKQKILIYATVFSNCGFMGFPLDESIFGHSSLMYFSIYVMIFNIFTWSYGVALLSRGENSDQKTKKTKIRDMLLNPGIIAVAIGFILWILPFSMPRTISYAIALIANCTTPLSMIVVGATLASLGVKGLFSGMEVWIGSFMRLLVLPAIFIIFMKILKQDDFPTKVANLLVAMPAAAQTVIFAERHDADVLLASKIVFISTVLSAATIPIIAQLLKI